jgi:NAD(P)-dependent dehydrogenase (short-subunit alcohol dehydrogenase family)
VEALLEGQVALVTGAASGIGRATVLGLSKAAATVAIVDRDRVGASHVVELAKQTGVGAAAFVVDLADAQAIAPLVALVLEAFERIDILVNCAGISGVAGEPRSSIDFTDEAFEIVMAINLRAAFLLTREVGRHMIDRGGGGRIVNVSSSAAFQARGTPAVYAASKAGLNALTRVSAADLAPHGINVNAVAPGVTKTPIIGVGMSDADYDRIVSAGPYENFTHRAADAEDVANVIRFLCLPESREVTGQVIHTSAGAVV